MKRSMKSGQAMTAALALAAGWCVGTANGQGAGVAQPPGSESRATQERATQVPKPVDIAINCEASIMIAQDDWFYLLATHGSCCQGANSNYNIRVGRSESPTGPFIDHDGLDMKQAGGKLFLGSESRLVDVLR